MDTGTVLAILGLGITIMAIVVPQLFPAIPRLVNWVGFIIGVSLTAAGCIVLATRFLAVYAVRIVASNATVADLGHWPFAVAMFAIIIAAVIIAQYATHFLTSPLIEIVTPTKGSAVEWSTTISGLVRPADSFVQVFILSGDDKWWPYEAIVNGAAWTVKCDIGNETVPPGRSYKIVAISGAKKVRTAQARLPRGESRSRTITVTRK